MVAEQQKSLNIEPVESVLRCIYLWRTFDSYYKECSLKCTEDNTDIMLTLKVKNDISNLYCFDNFFM